MRHGSSAVVASDARQVQTASSATLGNWRERDERIAILLRTHLGHGLKRVLCDAVGLRDYQVSKQFAGESRLQRCVIDVGACLLEQEGKAEVAAEIRILHGGSTAIRLDPVTFVYDPMRGTLELLK